VPLPRAPPFLPSGGFTGGEKGRDPFPLVDLGVYFLPSLIFCRCARVVMALVSSVLVALVVGALAAEDLLGDSRISAVVDGFQVCAFLINPPSLAADLNSPAFLFHLRHRDPSPISSFRPIVGVFPLPPEIQLAMRLSWDGLPYSGFPFGRIYFWSPLIVGCSPTFVVVERFDFLPLLPLPPLVLAPLVVSVFPTSSNVLIYSSCHPHLHPSSVTTICFKSHAATPTLNQQ
jgi:hypothetical protein